MVYISSVTIYRYYKVFSILWYKVPRAGFVARVSYSLHYFLKMRHDKSAVRPRHKKTILLRHSNLTLIRMADVIIGYTNRTRFSLRNMTQQFHARQNGHPAVWRGARADMPLCGQFSPLSHRAHVLCVTTPRWKQTLTSSDLLLFTPAE